MTDTRPTPRPVIAWDFDGVLNRNMHQGKFRWAKAFEREIGLPMSDFVKIVFGAGYDAVITGQEDLRDRVAHWAEVAGYAPGADHLLQFWFEADHYPDPEMLALMQQVGRLGARQVIATNNEPRRTAHIAGPLGYATRVERIFASGQMGRRKPDPAYFRQIERALCVTPAQICLVDDTEPNILAAHACGWHAIHMPEGSQARIADQVMAWLQGWRG